MRFLRERRGAITVFECIIFTALLILAGIIIDAARIMVAERKVQSAVNTSARSVLAGYSKDLVGDYGIFGVNTKTYDSTAQADFINYLEQNIVERNSNFNFINYEISADNTKTFIKGSGNLLAGYNFRNQILQYMKYRAPLTVTQNVIDKFTASGLSRKVKFAGSEKQVRAKWKALKSQIDEINELVAEVEGSNSKDIASLKTFRKKLQKALELNQHIDGLLQDYNREKTRSDGVAGPMEQGEMSIEGSNIITSRHEFESLQSKSSSLQKQIDLNIQKLDSVIGQIDELQLKVTALKNETASLELRIKDMERARKNQKTESAAQSIKLQIDTLKADLEEINQQITALHDRIYQIQAGINFNKMSELPAQGKISQPRPADPDLENRTQNFLNNFSNDFEKYLQNIDPDWLIEDEEFETAEQNDEAAANQMIVENMSEPYNSESAERKNDNVLAFMQRFFDMLADTGRNGIEKVYLVEYIMDKYTYVTSRTERDHLLEKGEIEYILWGGNNQTANIAKTMGSIWFLRFAIDTVDKFATSAVPEPTARLIGALLEGFALSCYDMVDLYRGKDISICPSLKKALKVNYADHLRVFLLMGATTDSGEKARLNNMRQLIQVNIKQLDDGFALKNYFTTLHGKAEVRINLWFLPVLQLDKLGIKGFEGGKYVVVKEAYVGY